MFTIMSAEKKKDTESGFFALYTQRSRHAIVLAQEEARSMAHRYIGAEHLLLGLLREGGGVAHRVLDSLGITLEDARSRVEHMVGRNVGREGLEPSSTGQLSGCPSFFLGWRCSPCRLRGREPRSVVSENALSCSPASSPGSQEGSRARCRSDAMS